MPRRPRLDPLHFAMGEIVEIANNPILTSYAGRLGVVIAIKSSPHSHALDKYTIRFVGGTEALFFDIQLRSALKKTQ